MYELLEGEDIVYEGMTEETEKFKMRKFGHGFHITEEAFVNDDTSELTRLFNAGTSAAKKESDVVYEQLFKGTVNGVALFDASHNNVLTGKNIFAADGSVGNAILDADKALSMQTIMGDAETDIDFNLGTVVSSKNLKYDLLKFKTEVFPTVPKQAQIFREFETITESRIDKNTTDAGPNVFYAIAGHVRAGYPVHRAGLPPRTY